MSYKYIKHLINCKCILPQFKSSNPPIFHSFVVFSSLTESGDVEQTYSQCNNCGVIHKVTEIGSSTVIRKEELASIETAEEIKLSLPDALVKILAGYELPLHTWQEIRFIIDNELWGQSPVILSREIIDDSTLGKCLLILGKELYKINSFNVENFIK